jgi:hypothetical protein
VTEALELAEDSSLVALGCVPEEEVVAAQLLVRRVQAELSELDPDGRFLPH